MPDIVTSKTFIDGERGITAAKMNQIISGAVIQPAFYSAKASSPTLDPTDVLLELKGTGTYAQITGSQLISSVGAALSVTTTFISKSAAYTLTSTDNNKYIICSGGSWTLTLPSPAVGLIFRVRNDQGITGTTGTITLQTAGGTIDGLASIPLLPQQDCTIISDGVNWRTFGLRREVVLGTQDITTSTANGVVLLPLGYRCFELEFTGLVPVASFDYMLGRLSTNGGSTWVTTGYFFSAINNTAATTVGNFNSENGTSFYLAPHTGYTGMSKLTIYPGAAKAPVWLVDAIGRSSGDVYVEQWRSGGFNGSTSGVVNALQYFFAAGNIANSFLTVKGVV